MRIYNAALIAAASKVASCAAFTARVSSSRAFIGGSTSVLPKPMTSFTNSVIGRRLGSALQMNLFSSLFGGGAYVQKIDYATLDFPGNELGQMALDGKIVVNSEREPQLQAATFAGGCFWGLELAYQRVPGVVYTAVGYTQGSEEAPKYEQVCAGATRHTEAVLVYYDPKECTFEDVSIVCGVKDEIL